MEIDCAKNVHLIRLFCLLQDTVVEIVQFTSSQEIIQQHLFQSNTNKMTSTLIKIQDKKQHSHFPYTLDERESPHRDLWHSGCRSTSPLPWTRKGVSTPQFLPCIFDKTPPSTSHSAPAMPHKLMQARNALAEKKMPPKRKTVPDEFFEYTFGSQNQSFVNYDKQDFSADLDFYQRVFNANVKK